MGSANQTSFAAELFVAAELTKQGHVVTVTFGNEKAIDLLVAKSGDPRNTASIDVKGLSSRAPWALGNYANKTKHPDVYIFCHLNKPSEHPEYFVVPTKEIESLVHHASNRKSCWLPFERINHFRNRWDLIWVS